MKRPPGSDILDQRLDYAALVLITIALVFEASRWLTNLTDSERYFCHIGFSTAVAAFLAVSIFRIARRVRTRQRAGLRWWLL